MKATQPSFILESVFNLQLEMLFVDVYPSSDNTVTNSPTTATAKTYEQSVTIPVSTAAICWLEISDQYLTVYRQIHQ